MHRQCDFRIATFLAKGTDIDTRTMLGFNMIT